MQVRAGPDLQGASLLAEIFMDQMEVREYSQQWSELAPEAQSLWPSEGQRAAMLEAKFSGASVITGFSLGPSRGGYQWSSGEDPQDTVTDALEVPVTVTFASPSSLSPAGVASDYRSLPLVMVPIDTGPVQANRGGGEVGLRVVGEGPASMDAPVILPSAMPARSASVPILMYHLVGPLPDRAIYTNSYSYQLDYGLTVPPAQFQAEINYLSSQGYSSISLARLSDNLFYGLSLPPKPVILTFDDGFLNEYEYALPVLEAAGFTAVFFPCTGLLGETNGHEPYMSAADLQTLVQDGFWVEDHTYNDGTSLWGRSPSEIDYLAGSTASRLVSITGSPVQFIAYSGLWPFRSATEVRGGEAELFHELAALGYVGGLEDNWLPGSRWQESSSAPWELPRLRAYPGEPLGVFASIVSQG